jgi:hypothetical protein
MIFIFTYLWIERKIYKNIEMAYSHTNEVGVTLTNCSRLLEFFLCSCNNLSSLLNFKKKIPLGLNKIHGSQVHDIFNTNCYTLFITSYRPLEFLHSVLIRKIYARDIQDIILIKRPNSTFFSKKVDPHGSQTINAHQLVLSWRHRTVISMWNSSWIWVSRQILFQDTSKVPVLRYEIKNLEVEHKFLKIYFLITILDYR